MKLFLLTRPDSCGYDEYNSAVVAAISAKRAAKTNPDGFTTEDVDSFGTWAPRSKVKVEYIGVARKGTKEGVICASFNAG